MAKTRPGKLEQAALFGTEVLGVPLPVGARSALIVLQTSAGASSKSEYLMDLVRFGPLDVIFVDPFDPPPP